MARPVIIDTDLGNDIDDSWALALALRSPELDVRLVVASTGDPLYRAALVADLLAAADRCDVPIGIGCTGHSDPHETLRTLHDRTALDRHRGPVSDGIDAIGTTIERSEEPVTVLALGPLTTVAAALEAKPSLATQARLVAMQGSYQVGYHGKPGPVAEYNIVQDVDAARVVFAAPWTCTVAPLDTCGTVVLRGDRYRRIHAAAQSDCLVEAVLRHQRAWWEWWGRSSRFLTESGVLYDTVAVQLCGDESLVEIDEIGIELSDGGIMHPSPSGPTLRLATRWHDEAAFLDYLTRRLCAAGPTPRADSLAGRAGR